MNCHSGEICSGLGGDQNVIGRNSGPGNGQILMDNVQIRSLKMPIIESLVRSRIGQIARKG